MQKKWFLALVLLLTALSLAACGLQTVRGSGDVISETKSVSNFERIALSGSGRVIVTQGSAESLTIETDDNIMQYIQAEVENGTLKLGFVNGVNIISTTRLVFSVGVDDLSGLTVSGSGEIESDHLETDAFNLDISGSGKIMISDLAAGKVSADISGSGEVRLEGEAASQEIDISGSGKYLAGDVCSDRVDVHVSGSGDTTVCALETLNADVSGSGNIKSLGER
jgi:predicted small secreted protein